MGAPPHLDAGRIYRLAPFDEVVTELRKALAGDPAVPSQATTQGLYTLFGAGGVAIATLDRAALTARRTPAVSALATDALARHDVRRLAVFGTSVQAREHVRAMRWIRPSLERIEVVGSEPLATERFVAMLRGEGHPAVAASAADASSADLICLCTSSQEPALIKLSPGTHINAIDSNAVGDWSKARVINSDRGGLSDPTKGKVRVIDDLVALARGDLRRESADELTVFVSVGLAVADRVVATLAARNAGLIS